MLTALERLYWLYERMKTGRYPSRRQYCDAHEVTKSTFKRDIAFFRDRFNAPVDYDRRRGGYYFLDDSFELPSVWFKRTHLFLMLGVCGRFSLMTGGEPHEIAALRERLESILSISDHHKPHALFSFENVEWSRCEWRHLDELIEAMLGRKCVTIRYTAGATGKTSRRLVEPYRLHNYMGSWYLIAFCQTKKEPRTFLLGRISELAVNDEGFEAPRFDVDARLDSAFGIFKGEAAITVVLRFDPFAARFVRNNVWHEHQQLEDLADGSLRLSLPVADLTEISMKVLKYGSRVEVEAPAQLRTKVAEEARAVVALYEKLNEEKNATGSSYEPPPAV